MRCENEGVRGGPHVICAYKASMSYVAPKAGLMSRVDFKKYQNVVSCTYFYSHCNRPHVVH